MTSDSAKVKENCQAARNWIKDYIAKRRRGERESSIGDKTDILSLMLENADVFNDEFMVDELIGFQGAATETTHNVFQTILTSLMKDQGSLERVRSEF